MPIEKFSEGFDTLEMRTALDDYTGDSLSPEIMAISSSTPVLESISVLECDAFKAGWDAAVELMRQQQAVREGEKG